MNKKIIIKLLILASGCLLIAAIGFLGLCFIADEKNSFYLGSTLGCLLLSSLFNLIRKQIK